MKNSFFQDGPFITSNQTRKQEELARARKRWVESEWILSFLRTESHELPKKLSDEQLLLWNSHN
jgi:hypothetical protein